MADYFFDNPRPVKWCRPLIYGFLEADSQSFYAGQLVAYSSGVAAAASDNTTGLIGIAMKDATNVTSGNIEIPIYPLYSTDLWEIKLTNNGTLSAGSAFTQGTRYALYVASNVAYLDVNDTTNDAAIYIDDVDPTNRPYWGKAHFLQAACYLQVGTGA